MRFISSTRLITLMVALLAALALPAIAAADGKDVIRDCAQDGDLDENYSDEELEDAYANLPSDIDEYSDCRDVIKQAQAGGKGSADGTDDTGTTGGSTGSGGSSGNLTGENTNGSGGTASDQQELANRADAAHNGEAPDSGLASETASSSGSAGSDSGLPTAAIVAIILLILAGITGGLYMLRDRLPESMTSRIPGLGPGQSR
jgi:hypothetical protein